MHSDILVSNLHFQLKSKVLLVPLVGCREDGIVGDPTSLACNNMLNIIIGTETWLHDGIKTQEFLPNELGYSVYRSDRKTGTDHHGGVLIAVTKRLISDQVPELETNCEILWAKINLVGVNTLLVGAFYRPHM